MSKYLVRSRKKRYSRAIVFGSIPIIIALIATVAMRNGIMNLINPPNSSQEKTRSVNDIDYSPAKDSDNNDINNWKQSSSTEASTTAQSISVTLTKVSQNEDKSLSVRTLVGGVNNGVCILELSQDNKQPSYSASATIEQQNNLMTCSGFDVTNNQIPSSGEWTVKVTASSNDSSASATQNITLEK